MIQELINQRRRLIGQYFRATHRLPNIFNNEANNDFEQFYERRLEIGRELFNRLQERGIDVSSRNAVELFGNIYDIIGLGNSVTVDRDTRALRNNGANIISNLDDYHISCFRGHYDIENITPIRMPSCTRYQFRSVIYRRFQTFILVNPHNEIEHLFMRNMSIIPENNQQNMLIGYYGDINDFDREAHREEIERLSNRNGVEPIINENEHTYSYLLRNRN